VVEKSRRHGYQRNLGGIATRDRYEMTVNALHSGQSSVYRCETFSKVGNGAMARFKQYLGTHSTNRIFGILLGPNPRAETEK
jgi:hypothetical protein